MDKFDFFGSISSDLPISVIPGITSKKSSMIRLSQKSQQPTLPPDLLIRILKYLPITSLPNFARACRRFKVLVYDDELWEQRLKTLGVWKDYENGDIMNAPVEPLYVNAKHTVKVKDNNHDSNLFDFDPLVSPPASPTTPNNNGNLLDFAISTANSLIPGLPLDSFSQKSRAASTGFARSSFKKIYLELLPYYIDFRHKRKDSRLFKEYNDPSDQSKMLARLLSFGKLNITLDSEQINNALETTIEYFENSALHHFELAYNAQNTSEMQKWATILLNLNGGSACIQVFIQKNSIFFDHLYDPMDNFTCLSISNLGELNYMQMTEFFNYVEEEIIKQASLISQIFPQDADVFYTFVERVVEDVIIEYISILLEESYNRDISLYLKTVVATHQRCIHIAKVLWKDAKPGLTKIRAEDLIYQLFEPFMDKYLKEELNYVKMQSEEEIEKWNQKLINKSMEAQQDILNNANREIYKRNYLSSFRKILKLPTARSRHSSPVQSSSSNIFRNKRNSASNISSSNPTLNVTDLQSALSNAKLDKMQQMLSLETALQMVHVNKDSLRRVSSFTGYPDKMGYRIKETLESVFITLLQTLGPLHIKPAFNTATKHLGDIKSDSESTSDLAPLVEFFELVHIADLIQQMVQVYYDEEMNKFIDKTDFLNNCNKEKKVFEKTLDESVAAGLNKGIQVLMDHVEFILAKGQKPEEFKPANDDSFDLQPTKACIDAVECLSKHTKLVIGCSDKHILDVFFQEIGLRFFGTLTKHIKKFTVSLSGGFQVISDLNHYCSFIISLQQSNITPYFIALKELGNIYIISNARDIGSFVREADRFNGVLHAEDVYEFCQKREDWLIIKKEVDKELYGLKAEDCTIM